ncbi:hypothetical protein ACIA5D_29350 [Actinoplanes sp. NPDC051513]|uniref:hypothetical protein n=1 Tax=Actinoplanes sp. NPDC051513 TaxID=3363908 RepID=UPI0037AC31FE
MAAGAADGPGRSALTLAEQRQVAEALRLGTPKPVRIPFGVSYVPDGYKLVEVTTNSAQFVPTADAVARLGKPDPLPDVRSLAAIRLSVGRASADHGTPRDGVLCPELPLKGGDVGRMGYCYAFLGDTYVEEARSRSAVDTVELGRMIKSGRFVPLSDPGNWIPVGAAFPASALVGGE